MEELTTLILPEILVWCKVWHVHSHQQLLHIFAWSPTLVLLRITPYGSHKSKNSVLPLSSKKTIPKNGGMNVGKVMICWGMQVNRKYCCGWFLTYRARHKLRAAAVALLFCPSPILSQCLAQHTTDGRTNSVASLICTALHTGEAPT